MAPLLKNLCARGLRKVDREFSKYWTKWAMIAGPIINRIGEPFPWTLTLIGYCAFISIANGVGMMFVLIGDIQGGFIEAVFYGLVYFGAIFVYLTTRLTYEHNRETYYKYIRNQETLSTPEKNVQSYVDYLEKMRVRNAEKEAAKTKKYAT